MITADNIQDYITHNEITLETFVVPIFFYMIKCIDENILHSYVGSTADFENRQDNHKSCCNSSNTIYEYKLYNIMRKYGGFNNWKFIIINRVLCNENERKLVEQFYIDKYKPTMNSYNVIRCENYRANYYNTNRDDILYKKKDYYIKNRDTRLQYQRNYRYKTSNI